MSDLTAAWTAFVITVASIVVVTALFLLSCSPKPQLTKEDGQVLVEFGKRLAICEAEARDAGHYAAFDACARREGIK
jgi:hypothetical protein